MTPTARLFAWMGAGLFVLSLSYFIYSYWAVFGRHTDGPLGVGVVVWNVVLFSVFALHHTVFARERMRRALTQALGPLERSFYVWVASLLFIAVCRLWLPLPGIVWEVEGAARLILIFLQIGGITFSVYSAARDRYLGIGGHPAAQFPTPNSQLPTPIPTTPNAQLPKGVRVQDDGALRACPSSDLSGMVLDRLRGGNNDHDPLRVRSGQLRLHPARDPI